MEIRSSSSASHDTTFRKKSRLPWAPRNWLDAKSAVPTTTMRAFAVFLGASAAGVASGLDSACASTVATTATGSGPVFSFGSGTALPVWNTFLSVSPHDCRLVWASGEACTPFGMDLAGSTERLSGNRVITPPMSLVMGCVSYWPTTGTSGPTPKT